MRDPGPSYPWYASDALGSSTIQKMTLEQEACYRRLLDFQWLDGKIPKNFLEIRSLLKNISRKKFEAMWVVVGQQFEELPDGSGLINPRLNHIRNERIAFIEERSKSGAKGGKKSWKVRSSASSSGIRDGEANVKPPFPIPHSPSPIAAEEGELKPLAISSPVVPKYPTAFESFWQKSTRRGSKVEAVREWKKLNPPMNLWPEILQGMTAWMASDQWQDETKQPHICRWLKRRGWEEIVPKSNHGTTGNGYHRPTTEEIDKAAAELRRQGAIK